MGMTRWQDSIEARSWANRIRVRGENLQAAWLELLSPIQWAWFVTLTFDPKRVYPVGCTRAAKEAFKWCGLVEWACRRPVLWMIAPERGASGQWHVHVLLAEEAGDVSALAAIWRSRNGEIDVRPVTSSTGVILYATKQAAFSGEILLSNPSGGYRRRTTDSQPARIALYPSEAEAAPADTRSAGVGA